MKTNENCHRIIVAMELVKHSQQSKLWNYFTMVY